MPAKAHALLFIATGCQHCPMVLQSLSELVKDGTLAQLEIINLQQSPEMARQYHVRSVPWVKIGPFELTGVRSTGELKQWIARADDPDAMGDYFSELMTTGELDTARDFIDQHPETLPALLKLMTVEDSKLSIKVGVGALMEDLTQADWFDQHLEQLAQYLQHDDPRVRNDAAYYLGLTLNPGVIAYLEPLLQDRDEDVRTTAAEAIEELRNRLQ